MFLYLVQAESSRILCCKVYKGIGVVFRWFYPRSVWASSEVVFVVLKCNREVTVYMDIKAVALCLYESDGGQV